MLEPEPVAAVVSSPRRRAVDTATPIAGRHGLEVEIVPDLRELDFGELEGRTYDEIADSLPELYAAWMTHPTRVRFPGGECYAELARALRRGGRRAAARGSAPRRSSSSRTAAWCARCSPTCSGSRTSASSGSPSSPASLTTVEWLGDEPVVTARQPSGRADSPTRSQVRRRANGR